MTTASVATNARARTREMWRCWRTMIKAFMVPSAVMFLPRMMHRKIGRVAASIHGYAVRIRRETVARIPIGGAVIGAEAAAQPA